MLGRLGSALILIGIVLMVIFLVTSSAGQGSLTILLSGAAVSALGLWMRRSAAAQRQSSSRFQTLRRLMGEESDSDEDQFEG